MCWKISLLTPDKDYVSKALVFVIVLYVSSYGWVHFSWAVQFCQPHQQLFIHSSKCNPNQSYTDHYIGLVYFFFPPSCIKQGKNCNSKKHQSSKLIKHTGNNQCNSDTTDSLQVQPTNKLLFPSQQSKENHYLIWSFNISLHICPLLLAHWQFQFYFQHNASNYIATLKSGVISHVHIYTGNNIP